MSTLRSKQSEAPDAGRLGPMRVLWLVPGFPTAAEPHAYSFLQREAEHLSRSEEVELVIASEVAIPPSALYDVVQLRRPRSNWGRLGALVSAVSSRAVSLRELVGGPSVWYPTVWRMWATRNAIRKSKPDVVHSHFCYPAGTSGAEHADARGATTVVSLRGVDVAMDAELDYGFRLNESYRRRFLRGRRHVAHYVVATDHMRQVANDAGIPTECLSVLPNAVEPSNAATESGRSVGLRKSLLIPNDAVVAISVGHVIARKGFDLGIETLRHIEDVHLVVVGDGPLRSDLVNQAICLGVANRVHFMGAVDHGQVLDWMSQADVYWFLSRIEAFGNVLLEAAVQGLAIVAVDRGAASLVCEGVDRARLVPFEPQRVAAATTQVLAESRSDERRAEFLESFRPERRTEQLLRIYALAQRGESANGY